MGSDSTLCDLYLKSDVWRLLYWTSRSHRQTGHKLACLRGQFKWIRYRSLVSLVVAWAENTWQYIFFHMKLLIAWSINVAEETYSRLISIRKCSRHSRILTVVTATILWDFWRKQTKRLIVDILHQVDGKTSGRNTVTRRISPALGSHTRLVKLLASR